MYQLAATLALTIVLFFIIFSIYGLLVSIRPPKITSSLTPRDLGLTYEKATFITSDGVELAAWFTPSKGVATDKLIILLHGYPADKGNILPTVAFLAQDFNLLLFDFRALGESGGRYTTIGAREARDIEAAVSYATAKGFENIGVWGFSMGGAVALMSAAKIPAIGAVVADSSYAELSLAAQELYRNFGVLKYPLASLTGLWAKLFLGIDINEVSPRRAASGLTTPVLLIHNKDDQDIPFRHALLLKEALKNNQRAEFWFEGRGVHGALPAGYEERMRNFFLKHL